LKVVKPRGGDIILTGVQPKVYEVFQLLGFTNFFNFKDTVEEALQSLRPELKPIKKVKQIFPKTFRCRCQKKLRTAKPGRFKCPQCGSIITVLENGKASLR
jgi:hypothetical protein